MGISPHALSYLCGALPWLTLLVSFKIFTPQDLSSINRFLFLVSAFLDLLFFHLHLFQSFSAVVTAATLGGKLEAVPGDAKFADVLQWTERFIDGQTNSLYSVKLYEVLSAAKQVNITIHETSDTVFVSGSPVVFFIQLVLPVIP